MSIEFDRARIEGVLDAACGQLQGDWVLIGGALAAIWFSPDRKTEDLDMVSLSDASADRLQLMELATGLGLPVEAVNSAADFFLRRVSGWQQELVLLRTGKRCRIYRVTPTLFLLLKVGRLSEVDLEDCLRLIATCRTESQAIENTRVLDALNALPPTEDRALADRRGRLVQALQN